MSQAVRHVEHDGSHTPYKARHSGAAKPSERAILDLFCKAAENLPIQEVADHVGLKILDTLVDEDKPAWRSLASVALRSPTTK